MQTIKNSILDRLRSRVYIINNKNGILSKALFKSISSASVTTSLIFYLFIIIFMYSPTVLAIEVGHAPQQSTATTVVDGIGTAQGVSITSATPPSNTTSNNSVLPSQSHVDESSGAFLWSLPLTLPKGRAGLTPSLTLSYDSRRNNVTSYIGRGWELDIPYIQRLNKSGVDLMYDKPDFASSTQGELTRLTPMTSTSFNQSGWYGAKSGYGRYELRNDNSWKMTDLDGNVYIYGATIQQREQGSNTTISSWYLSSITDPHGNKIEYIYTKDAYGRIYPSAIMYGDGMYKIDFEWTIEGSQSSYVLGTTVDYAAGLKSKPDRILKAIAINAKNESRLRYSLTSTNVTTYTNQTGYIGNSITAVQKKNITQISICGASSNNPLYQIYTGVVNNCTSIETYNFTYSSPPITSNSNGSVGYGGVGFIALTVPSEFPASLYGTTAQYNAIGTLTPNWLYTSQNNSNALMYAYVDLDSDGWKENVSLSSVYTGSNNQTTHTFKVYGINAAKTGYELKPSYTFQKVTAPYGTNLFANKTLMGDIDNDGDIDMMIYVSEYVNGNTNYSYNLYRNSGNSFVLDANTVIPSFQYDNIQNVFLKDMNRDGKVDLVYLKPHPSKMAVYISDGSEFTLDPSYTVVGGNWTTIGSNNVEYEVAFVDINGDNYDDLIRSNEVFLNRKTHFEYSPTYSTGPNQFIGQGKLLDINGDTLPDVPNTVGFGTTSATSVGALINTGLGWKYIPNASLPEVYNYSNQYGEVNGAQIALYSPSGYVYNSPVDLNSDGIFDVVGTSGNGVSNLKIHPGTRENILTTVMMPSGNITTITYGHELLKNSSTNGNPISQYVVKTISDSTTPVNTTTYTYENGLQYFNNEDMSKKFAGFEKVTTVNTEGIKEISYYHQGNSSNITLGEFEDSQSKIGREYRTEVYSPQNIGGALVKAVITKWGTGNLGTGRSLVYKERVLSRNFLGGLYDTGVAYTYDTAYGQLVRVHDFGQVVGQNDGTFIDIGNDKETTEYKYITNGTIVRKVLETKKNQGGNTLTQTAFVYDNAGPLVKGLVTEVSKWIDSTNIAKTKYTYNNFGLVTSVTDPLQKVTSTMYDMYNLYPSKITNPLGQFTKLENYDYMAGKPTKTTDPKNMIIQFIYDAYGRETQVKRNNTIIRSASYSPTQHQISYAPSSYSAGSSDNVYFDGLGRVTQNSIGKKGAITYTYNSSGRVLTESLPSHSYNNSLGIQTTYTYDTLGRVKTAVNSLGTTITTYDVFKKSITNPKGITTTYQYDVRGNLLSVKENDGGSPSYLTTYTYDGNGYLSGITDAEANKRNFVTNLRGDVLSATDLHKTNDTSYGVVKKNYDIVGRTIKETFQDNKIITYSYDALGRLITKVVGSQPLPEEIVTYTYDTCGATLLCSESSSLGIATSYTYNSDGFIATKTQTIDGVPMTKSYTYDTQGQIMSITQPDGTIVSYDRTTSHANIEKISVDGAFFANNVYYDTESRIISIKYPTLTSEINTYYTYDYTKMLQLTSQKTTLNNATTDIINTSYTYDANGNITGSTETGHTSIKSSKTYTYDAFDRLTGYTTTPTGGSTSPADANTYSYSPTGSMMTSGSTVHSFGTNATSSSSTSSNSNNNQNPNQNSGGNNAGPNGGLSVYTPKEKTSQFALLLKRIVNKAHTFIARINPFKARPVYAALSCVAPQIYFPQINACAIPISCTLPKLLNQNTNTCYTPISQNDLEVYLKSRGFGKQESGRALIKPTHNKVTILFKKDFRSTPLISATPISSTDSKYYLSDISAGSFQIKLVEPAIEPITFNWTALEKPEGDDDDLYESQDETNTIDPSLLVLNTMNNSQLINGAETTYNETPINSGVGPTSAFTSPQALTKTTASTGDTVYTYDARGNMTSESVPTTIIQNGVPTIAQAITTHEWNINNMITKTTLPNGDIITYRYAPNGDRVMKTFTPLSPSALNPIRVTTYMDDEYEIEETKENLTQLPNTTISRSRVMLGSLHIGTVEKTTTPNTALVISKYFQYTDSVGSSTITTDNAGTIIQAQDTKPYGGYRVNTDTLYTSGTPSSPLNTGIKDYFALHERDIETGLTYMNARMYNENTPTFLSLDPASQYNPSRFLHDPQQLNLYAYARNNPVRYNDPSGEASFLINIKSSIKSIVNKILNSSKLKSDSASTAKKNSGSSGSWGSSKALPITNDKTTPVSNNKTWDSITDTRIKSLDKRVQGPATRFINRTESELNTKLRVTDGYRSYEQQEKLYWQSRTEPPTGPWVTNARGGESNHNFGMAIDVTVMENGTPYAKPISEDIVKIGKEEGFSWGGDWPKPYTDYPHFEFLIDNE